MNQVIQVWFSKLVHILIAIVLISLFLIMANIGFNIYMPLNKHKIVVLSSQQNTQQFINELLHTNDLSNSFFVKKYIHFCLHRKSLQAGIYQLQPNMSLHQLLQAIEQGKVIKYQLNIIPGEQWSEVKKSINPTILDKLFINNAQLEGVLLPNSYQYTNLASLQQKIVKARQSMSDYLNKAWQAKGMNLPYKTPYQALVMASILEKEAANAMDQQHIAGIFINRMHKHMPLDANATIRYAIQAEPGQPLYKKDFQVSSLYNTYRDHGLPPTPIAFPSKQAINAALHPMLTNDLYYISLPNGKYIYSSKPIHSIPPTQ